MNKTYQVVYETLTSHVNVCLKSTIDQAISYIEDKLKANPTSTRVYHILEQTSVMSIQHKVTPVEYKYTYPEEETEKELNKNG